MKTETSILEDIISELTVKIDDSIKQQYHILDESGISLCRQDASDILSYLKELQITKPPHHDR